MRTRRSDDTRISFFSFQDIITCLAGVMIFIALLLVLDLSTSALSPPAPSPAKVSDAAARRQTQDLRLQLERAQAEKQRLASESRQLAALDPQALKRQLADLEEKLRNLSARSLRQSTERRGQEGEVVRLRGQIRRVLAEIRVSATAKARLDSRPRRVVFTLPGEDNSKKDVLLAEISDARILLQPITEGTAAIAIPDRVTGSRQAALLQRLTAFPPAQYDVLVLLKPSAFGEAMDWTGVFMQQGYRVGTEPLEEDRSTIRSD